MNVASAKTPGVASRTGAVVGVGRGAEVVVGAVLVGAARPEVGALPECDDELHPATHRLHDTTATRPARTVASVRANWRMVN
jgi:hypothetical protein